MILVMNKFTENKNYYSSFKNEKRSFLEVNSYFNYLF